VKPFHFLLCPVTMNEIIKNPAPFQTEYLPSKFLDRRDETAALKSVLNPNTSRNLHIHGPRGSGKTHLTHSLLEELPDKIQCCYILCTRYDTQYKILKQVYQQITQQPINSGHHVSDLQRKITERTGAIPTVIILDEISFALLNDADSLLYFLSRNTENTSIITISANHTQLPVEERTQSSLHPQTLQFPAYTGKQVYRLLKQRAEDALKPASLEHEALTYIASTTSNIKTGLHWLRTAAKNAEDAITEELVHELEKQGYQQYVDQILEPFTVHHKLVYQAIQELSEAEKEVVRSGQIYQQYEEICNRNEESSLSQRRISDYLKHLELLNLIKAEYHYGGNKGKTREIELSK